MTETTTLVGDPDLSLGKPAEAPTTVTISVERLHWLQAAAERRYGQLLVWDNARSEMPEVVAKVMGQIIVTRAEHVVHTGQIHYIALSPHFNPVPDGQSVPFYDANYDFDTGVVTFAMAAQVIHG